jgi:hypothetical protein
MAESTGKTLCFGGGQSRVDLLTICSVQIREKIETKPRRRRHTTQQPCQATISTTTSVISNSPTSTRTSSPSQPFGSSSTKYTTITWTMPPTPVLIPRLTHPAPPARKRRPVKRQVLRSHRSHRSHLCQAQARCPNLLNRRRLTRQHPLQNPQYLQVLLLLFLRPCRPQRLLKSELRAPSRAR